MRIHAFKQGKPVYTSLLSLLLLNTSLLLLLLLYCIFIFTQNKVWLRQHQSVSGLASFCRWIEKTGFYHGKTALAKIDFLPAKTGFCQQKPVFATS